MSRVHIDKFSVGLDELPLKHQKDFQVILRLPYPPFTPNTRSV